MTSRGFFSVFVTAFAVIFLISFFYAQSVQYDSQSRSAELGVMQQELSKDWFMARNALTNFASDAILNKIETNVPAPGPNSCNGLTVLEFNDAVDNYWDAATSYMNARFGTNCDANLSVDVQNRLENLALAVPSVLNDKRAYGILSCSRSTSTSSLTVVRPFVIHKRITTTDSAAIECDVNVFDVLGDNPTPGNYRYSKQDVNKAFI